MEPWRDGRGSRRRVEIEGDTSLLDGLSEVLRETLAQRQRYYRVRLEGIGRCGEVLVAISSAKGRLPLLFGKEDLEPGYVASVVRHNVERYAF